MNEIIKKAVEELTKEAPDLSYIRGMLETVLAMSPDVSKGSYVKRPIDVNKTIQEYKEATVPLDDKAILEAGVPDMMSKLTAATEA